MDRRKFISLSCLSGVLYTATHVFPAKAALSFADGYIMTVNGKLNEVLPGVFLPHEHLVTDFIGAEKLQYPQYDRTTAFQKLQPYLQHAKKNGVTVIAECTPAYIGRDVKLLKQLSEASGVSIITNTGYYAAAGYKYLPRHAYTESSVQLSSRWLQEWKDGIEGTGIRPGFIKLGVDGGPLKEVEQKLVRAAAYTHLQSGLKIAIHNGNATAVEEELQILQQEGVPASALIWVHAQNDPDGQVQLKMAKKGCWVSLDGVSSSVESVEKYRRLINNFQKEGLLDRLLLSHDDGFAVNKNGDKVSLDNYENGNAEPYVSLIQVLKPRLLKDGLSMEAFKQVTEKNPFQAYKIQI